MKAVVTPYRLLIGSACETLQGHGLRMTNGYFMGGGRWLRALGARALPRSQDLRLSPRRRVPVNLALEKEGAVANCLPRANRVKPGTPRSIPVERAGYTHFA